LEHPQHFRIYLFAFRAYIQVHTSLWPILANLWTPHQSRGRGRGFSRLPSSNAISPNCLYASLKRKRPLLNGCDRRTAYLKRSNALYSMHTTCSAIYARWLAFKPHNFRVIRHRGDEERQAQSGDWREVPITLIDLPQVARSHVRASCPAQL
jgi:hypothetical protein